MVNTGDALAGMGGALVAAAGSGNTADRLVAGTGHLMAGVGGALAQAGQTMLGGGTGGRSGAPSSAGSSAGTGSVAAQEPTGDGLPRPHWVLRDKNGTPVPGELGPYFDQHGKYFTTAPTPVCFWLSMLGHRSIGLSYMVATGKIAGTGECPGGLPTVADWHVLGSYYLDTTCTGTAYASGANGAVMAVAGTAYYHDALGQSYANVYKWNTNTQKCELLTSNPGALTTWTQVPADIVTLLPNAPYSLELVYCRSATPAPPRRYACHADRHRTVGRHRRHVL